MCPKPADQLIPDKSTNLIRNGENDVDAVLPRIGRAPATRPRRGPTPSAYPRRGRDIIEIPRIGQDDAEIPISGGSAQVLPRCEIPQIDGGLEHPSSRGRSLPSCSRPCNWPRPSNIRGLQMSNVYFVNFASWKTLFNVRCVSIHWHIRSNDCSYIIPPTPFIYSVWISWNVVWM